MYRPPAIHKVSPLKKLARILTVLVMMVLGVLTLVGLADSPHAGGIWGVLGARQATIGLLAGHWQFDSGAVCPDGLQEVEITVDVANRVATLLRRQGYRVVVLPEYAPQLDGFRGVVFLAIHADSCIDMSGFKVVRMTQAEDRVQEDRLVDMLTLAYAEATGLRFHRDTITDDMRQYHALRRISPQTPGAIIEIGFMGGDRHLLTQEPDRVAAGIAKGLLAFLRGQPHGPVSSN
jgi:N-acetylmuramoyl-L-alanine amidase